MMRNSFVMLLCCVDFVLEAFLQERQLHILRLVEGIAFAWCYRARLICCSEAAKSKSHDDDKTIESGHGDGFLTLPAKM
jgi:hypothetical protein